MIIKRKYFSIWKKTAAGIRGAVKSLKYAPFGITGGLLLAFIPALIARIFGKKAFLITEALGAGVGLGFLMYLGYEEGIKTYEYNEKLKNDPEFKKKELEKEKTELKKYLSNKLNYSIPNSGSIINTLRKAEKNCNISFKDDLFKYIKFYESFYKKYYKSWYNVYKDCTSLRDIEIEFSYIFPEPVFDYDSLVEEINSSDKECVRVLGSLEYSDHGYLFYHFKENIYSFDLGHGYDSNSISDCVEKRCKEFKHFYDLDKVDKNYINIVKTHTEIIDRFIQGLRAL